MKIIIKSNEINNNIHKDNNFENKNNINEKNDINNLNYIKEYKNSSLLENKNILNKESEKDELIIKLFKELNILKQELINVKNELIILKKTNNEYKNIENEEYKLDENYLIKMMELRNEIGILNIFKKVYLENFNCPIKIESARKIYIFNNNKWILDIDGKIFTKILCENIQRSFSSINTVENIEKLESFIDNQVFINKLNNNNYTRIIYKSIINYVKTKI